MPVLIQLLIPLAVVGLLALVLRWAFGRGRGKSAQTRDLDRDRAAALKAAVEPPAVDDFGLLAPVGSFEGRGEAERVRGLLADAGIRATIAVRSDGRTQVLVFRNELLRARRVGGANGGSTTSGSN